MKTKLFIAGILVAFMICGCTSPRYLPRSEDLDVHQYGSYMIIRQLSGVHSRGELLAVDSSNIVILPESDTGLLKKPMIIPVHLVQHFSVLYAKRRHYGWTIPVFTLATLSHGFFLIFTAPVNLIATIIITVGGENAFAYNEKNITYDKLKMFARFPQGIPPGLDITNLK
jgi:hypothetical protein